MLKTSVGPREGNRYQDSAKVAQRGGLEHGFQIRRPRAEIPVKTHMHQIRSMLASSVPVAGASPDLRTVLAHDPDELARNLTDWEQCYDQISSGRFHGCLAERRLSQMQIFREAISQSVRQTCRAWPGSIWFGFPRHREPTRINGRSVPSEFVLLQAGGSEFELITPPDHVILGIVISRDMLADTAARMNCELDIDKLQLADALQIDLATRKHFDDALDALLAHYATAKAEDSNPRWQLLCQERIAAMLVTIACEGTPDRTVGDTFRRRQRVIARVREYVAAHRDEAISVPDLCECAHVSRRTLQYCFEDQLGVSPVAYLRMLRLNGVRRQLTDPAYARISIGGLAAGWGFANFSQFSSDYRNLFGESASASRRAVAAGRAD